MFMRFGDSAKTHHDLGPAKYLIELLGGADATQQGPLRLAFGPAGAARLDLGASMTRCFRLRRGKYL